MWGDFKDIITITTPKKYLQEQANKLYKATDQILKAEISSERTRSHRDLAYTLNIIAPRLNDYTKTIILIEHDLEPYPLTVRDYVNDEKYECANESSFLALLENILSSPKVQKSIKSLISHSSS